LIQFKRDLPGIKKLEIKYGCKGFNERKNFLDMNFWRLEREFELNLRFLFKFEFKEAGH
jgi:hypothetical protein